MFVRSILLQNTVFFSIILLSIFNCISCSSNKWLLSNPFSIADSETFGSFVSTLGDGFDVCGTIIRFNNISADSLGTFSTETELVEKLKETGIASVFHRKVIARNILAWKSISHEKSSLQALGDLQLPPKLGIKLSSLEFFIGECGGRSVLADLSTADVNNLYLKPLTGHMKASYCEYLKSNEVSGVGEAEVFISHSWESKFLDVVDTLTYRFRDNPDAIIWFDLFSINQHSSVQMELSWCNTTMKSIIEQFKHIIIISYPSNNPSKLKRLHGNSECTCLFDISLSPSDEENLRQAININCNYAKYLAFLSSKKVDKSKYKNESYSYLFKKASDSEDLRTSVLGLGEGFHVCGAIICFFC